MDQQSPEISKPDFYDLMPDPYKNRDKFDDWLENDLLSKIDTVPLGYGDEKPGVTEEQLLENLREQVRMQVYEQWIPGYTNLKRPQFNRPPQTPEQLRISLKESTSGFISQFSKSIPHLKT